VAVESNGRPEGAALVTGGSRGIGAAIAKALAAEGWPVAVNYRSGAEQAEAVVKEIVDAGGRAIAVQADVSQTGSEDALFKAVEEQLGPVLVLVNNAGVRADGLSPQIDDEESYSPAAYLPAPDADPAVAVEDAESADDSTARLQSALGRLDAEEKSLRDVARETDARLKNRRVFIVQTGRVQSARESGKVVLIRTLRIHKRLPGCVRNCGVRVGSAAQSIVRSADKFVAHSQVQCQILPDAVVILCEPGIAGYAIVVGTKPPSAVCQRRIASQKA